jgi:hypothetical protein
MKNVYILAIRYTVFVALLLIGEAQSIGAQPAIGAVHAVFTYPSELSDREQSVAIGAISGGAGYRLSLEPEIDVANHVIGLKLVLRDARDGQDGDNLLYISPRWHGYQKFIFAAADFIYGPARSTYGKVREIRIDRLRLDVRINVSDVSVKPIVETPEKVGHFAFEKMKLQVDVHNLAHN